MNAMALLLAVSFLQYFEARNTVANFVLEPPDESAPPVKVERPDVHILRKCPACEGKGSLVLQEPNHGQLDGRLGSARKSTVKCPVCKGKGKLESYVKPDDLATQIAGDREQFASAHQGKGDIAVGQAFIALAAWDEHKKDRKLLKLVEDAYGRPCTKCKWTGLEACRKCRGEGVLECTESNCKDGWSVTKAADDKQAASTRRGLEKKSDVIVRPCKACGGAKVVLCPECGGRGAKPCRSCGGVGLKQKSGGAQ